MDKRIAKRSREAEKEYVRDLSKKKKDQSNSKPNAIIGGIAALTTSVLETTNAWMFPRQGTKSSKEKVTNRIHQVWHKRLCSRLGVLDICAEVGRPAVEEEGRR